MPSRFELTRENTPRFLLALLLVDALLIGGGFVAGQARRVALSQNREQNTIQNNNQNMIQNR